ncbi:MAG TPA: sulfur carrier protein ThiS [Stackebrandtia sp.]|jgi:sulfur carrier protein|uniref:sulfur carrier protein ThiS n=1 Tax=Stackebrandtia sp. TaxID=2023065 RepID=UPI002D718C9A|nr:sulfur carrier protein ThiS [Stackebrandtia sp.]HZE41398.1 sulfur carrier protein ThiS [Stackebrandtia sp.]
MRLRVNGGDVELPEPTLAEAVATVTDARRGIAVAVNGEVIPKAQWTRPLSEGDSVEILTATQGG